MCSAKTKGAAAAGIALGRRWLYSFIFREQDVREPAEDRHNIGQLRRYGGSDEKKMGGEENELVSIHRDGALIILTAAGYIRCLMNMSWGYNMTRLFPSMHSNNGQTLIVLEIV